MLKTIEANIMNGIDIKKDLALSLYDVPLEDLLEVTKSIFNRYRDNQFDFCTIINGKNGRCSEDCKYCAQSAHFSCEIQAYDLLDEKIVLEDAKTIEEKGIKKYSIVTSGKVATEAEVNQLTKIYRRLSDETGLYLCASHGLLDYDALKRLKEAGVRRIHNNLETSRNYFEDICTTHTYDDKIQTIKDAQALGFEVCSGGIIGMGESREDRIDLAFELKDLEINSIPLNLLNPIEGTPIAHLPAISEEEFIRTCAIFRLIMPKAVIRLAGGRGLLSDKGKKVFETCINGAITGELLTTSGNDTITDMTMIKELNYEF